MGRLFGEFTNLTRKYDVRRFEAPSDSYAWTFNACRLTLSSLSGQSSAVCGRVKQLQKTRACRSSRDQTASRPPETLYDDQSKRSGGFPMSKLLSDVDPALAVHAVAFDNLTVPVVKCCAGHQACVERCSWHGSTRLVLTDARFTARSTVVPPTFPRSHKKCLEPTTNCSSPPCISTRLLSRPFT